MYDDTSHIETADNDVRYVQTDNMNFCGLAHETRYNWVLEQYDLTNKIILDFGCGSGYGAYMLTKRAQLVLGVDQSQRAIEYAIGRYQSKNLKFINIDACSKDVVNLLGEHSFDFIISFDVIEHIERYFDYIENISALMKKDGTFILGCPNRLQTFKWNRYWNPFHFQEFSPYQLRKILSLYFGNIQLHSQDFKDAYKRELFRSANYNSAPESEKVLKKKFKRLKKNLKKLLTRKYFKAKENSRNHIHTERTQSFDYLDIEFVSEPSNEILERAFGLVAVCKKKNVISN